MIQRLAQTALVRHHPLATDRVGLCFVVTGTVRCVIGGWLAGPLLFGQSLTPDHAVLAAVNWLAGPLEAAVGGILHYAARYGRL